MANRRLGSDIHSLHREPQNIGLCYQRLIRHQTIAVWLRGWFLPSLYFALYSELFQGWFKLHLRIGILSVLYLWFEILYILLGNTACICKNSKVTQLMLVSFSFSQSKGRHIIKITISYSYPLFQTHKTRTVNLSAGSFVHSLFS